MTFCDDSYQKKKSDKPTSDDYVLTIPLSKKSAIATAISCGESFPDEEYQRGIQFIAPNME